MTLSALKENHKTYIMLTLLIGASYLTYYYHVVLKTDIIFTHLFYIPIALACIWWKRRGIAVALFLGAMLLISHAFFVSNFSLIHDVFRSLMFVAAAVVVALLSEQAERASILYRTVADSSHTGIYIIQNGKFRYLNRNTARHAGYAAEDMIRMDPLTVVHPDDRKGVEENAYSMLKGKLSTPYERRIIEKDGQIRYIMETVTPVEYQGERALLDTANILRQTFRESDISARKGGDEFAVLANDVADMNPEILSDRLEQIIAVLNTKANRPHRLSMSWGAAIYDPDGPKALDHLMSEADELMYLRKKAKLKISQ